MNENVLVVTDVQRDFCKGGSLPAQDTESLIGPLNEAIRKTESLGFMLIFPRDWHPPNHESFKDQGGPWPPHCIQNTPGAEFHPDLYIPKSAHIITKGYSPFGMGYSPYEEEEMNRLIKTVSGIVYISGLTLEYCVRATCLDTLKLGRKAYAIKNLVRPVSGDPEVTEKIWKELQEAGCQIMDEFPF